MPDHSPAAFTTVRNGELTLDTRLADIGSDNATDIDDDLIDTSKVGDDWGLAWDRVIRSDADATVRDLRDALLRASS